MKKKKKVGGKDKKVREYNFKLIFKIIIVEAKEEQKSSEKQYKEKTREYTNAELLARRQSALRRNKIKIGVLCSGLLESPEEKVCAVD